MHNLAKTIIAVTAAGILGACATSGTQKSATEVPKLGKPISEQTVALWNIDIRTKDGLGLPGGSGRWPKVKPSTKSNVPLATALMPRVVLSTARWLVVLAQ